MENTLRSQLSLYSGRKVCITGHTGFKGSWLSLWLQHLGARVLGYSQDPPSSPAMYHELELEKEIYTIKGSVADYDKLYQAIQDFQPEVVFHLAAQSLVRPSYEDPIGTLQSNVMGTANLLDVCRKTPSVQAIVIVTSDKCYRNNEWVWPYRENDPMGGHDPYSVSKGCAELITSSYIKSFFNPELFGVEHKTAVASARAGNAIGGGDWAKDRLIPDCVRSLGNKEIIQIRYPKAVRPWQHALECLSGYLQLGAGLLEHGPKFGCGWNFAPIDMGDVWPVERVVKYICELWGEGSYHINTAKHLYEANMLCLDCTKANIELGWRPRYNVAQAIQETIAWYKEWDRTKDALHMRTFSLDQIERYVDAISK